MKKKIGKREKAPAASPPPAPATLDPHDVIVAHWHDITGKPKEWVRHKLIEIGHMTLKQMTGGVNDARREMDSLGEAVSEAKAAAEANQ